jgi:hypothetical protein
LHQLLHLGAFEIAPDSQNHILGLEILRMETDEVFAADRFQRSELDLMPIGGIFAFQEAAEFARADGGGIVIAPQDGAGHLLFAEVDLFLRENRLADQVREDFQGARKVFRQRADGGAALILADSHFDGGCAVIELVIQSVAGKALAAAGANYFAHDGGQTCLGDRLPAGTGIDQELGIDERQFMVFHEVESEAVLEHGALRFLNFDGVKRRHLKLAEVRGRLILALGRSTSGANAKGERKGGYEQFFQSLIHDYSFPAGRVSM